MKIRSWTSLLAVALVSLPVSAFAQCGMMTGGGHEHGQQSGNQHEPKAPKGVDEKAKRNAKKLLDDSRGREALLEAVLEDAGFTRLLVARLLEAPEWRSLISERLGGSPEVGGATVGDDRAAPPKGAAPPPRAIYECPMHPEVVSDRPGVCPKCGMRLERVPDEEGE